MNSSCTRQNHHHKVSLSNQYVIYLSEFNSTRNKTKKEKGDRKLKIMKSNVKYLVKPFFLVTLVTAPIKTATTQPHLSDSSTVTICFLVSSLYLSRLSYISFHMKYLFK